MRRPKSAKAIAALTKRWREVVSLVRRGLSNRAIAERLGVSEGTVKVHLHAIYEKLDIHSRIELVSASFGGNSKLD
jgi:two-component system nitrate/nitrite response regulator NarP